MGMKQISGLKYPSSRSLRSPWHPFDGVDSNFDLIEYAKNVSAITSGFNDIVPYQNFVSSVLFDKAIFRLLDPQHGQSIIHGIGDIKVSWFMNRPPDTYPPTLSSLCGRIYGEMRRGRGLLIRFLLPLRTYGDSG
jgi:hypothetical protein